MKQESNLKLYTVKEVAEILRVHPNTVYEYVKEGKLKAYRIGEKLTLRFTRDQILSFVGGNSDVLPPLDD